MIGHFDDDVIEHQYKYREETMDEVTVLIFPSTDR